MKLSEMELGTPYMYDKYRNHRSAQGTCAMWILTKDTYRGADRFERERTGADFVKHERGAHKSQFVSCGLLCISYTPRWEKDIPEHVAEVLGKVTFKEVQAAGMRVPPWVAEELGESELNRVAIMAVQPSTLSGPSWEAVRDGRKAEERRDKEARQARQRQEQDNEVRARKIAEALRQLGNNSYSWVRVERGEMRVDLSDLEKLVEMAGLGD